MARGYGNEKDKSGVMEVTLAVAAIVCILIGLIWLFASTKLVWLSLKPMLFLGAIWKLLPFDFAIERWNSLVIAATRFAYDLRGVGLGEWSAFMNTALQPYVFLLSLGYFILLGALFKKKRSNIFRIFQPKDLLDHTVRVFSGIAPVIAIRKKIVANELPQWRTQVPPEEVFLGRHGPNGNPMVQIVTDSEGRRQEKFLDMVAYNYFWGLKEPVPGVQASRFVVSSMLGRQVVHLLADRGTASKICFPDRLSDAGKALFALWAAVAFGGQEGKKEYTEFCRLLNMSAYGSPTGAANLTVAQPLYNKYRTNKEAANIFAVHHWEHTALFALLEIAQRRGRYTTAEVLWLRPMNRIMFFSLNSCGAKTPHVEAAATFNQFYYERACFSLKRLPLQRTAEGLQHYICVDEAVAGLRAEYEHWAVSSDENDEWWKSPDLWRRADTALSRELKSFEEKSVGAIPEVKPGADTDFDQQQSEARAKAMEL